MPRLSALLLDSATIALLVAAILVSASTQAQHHEPVANSVDSQGYPTLTLHGFGDQRYYSDTATDEGDTWGGQQVAHAISAWTERITAFGEFSFTNQEKHTDSDVERLILRYDLSDSLKVSGGRYHTSMGYWNTNYHHGAWLQTTIDRPRIVKFGSQLVPIHFEGLLLEGSAPVGAVSLGYRAGFGAGLHNNIDVYGNTGDIDSENAVSLQLYARGDRIQGLEVGFSYFRDEVKFDNWNGQPVEDVEEDIYGVHAVLDRESLELLGEIQWWDHSQGGNPLSSSTGHGYYLQASRRLSGSLSTLKPYMRFDKVSADNDDLLFASDQSWEGMTVGVRWDFNNFAAFKLEYRNEKQGDESRVDSIVAQVSFVLLDLISL
jgi:hypothetical protein